MEAIYKLVIDTLGIGLSTKVIDFLTNTANYTLIITLIAAVVIGGLIKRLFGITVKILIIVAIIIFIGLNGIYIYNSNDIMGFLTGIIK